MVKKHVKELETLAGMLTPLVMTAIGFQLRIRLSPTVLQPLGFGLAVKLAIAPLVALLVCRLPGFDGLAAALVRLGMALAFVSLPVLYRLV